MVRIVWGLNGWWRTTILFAKWHGVITSGTRQSSERWGYSCAWLPDLTCGSFSFVLAR